MRKAAAKERQIESPAAIGGSTLPSTWRWARLEEVAADEPGAITDGPFGSKLKTEHYASIGPRVIRLQNIGEGEFIDSYAHISADHFASLQKHRVLASDLLVAALGQSLPRSCVAPDSLGPAIVKADCIRIRPRADVSVRFVNFALNYEGTRRRVAKIVHGVGRPRLNLSEIKSIEIPLPSLPEQKRIVAEIEKHFTRLDAGVAALRRVQANLKRYRVAVLKAACEGRLVPTEAELARREGRSYESGEQLLDRVCKHVLTSSKRHLVRQVPTRLRERSGDIGLPSGWTPALVRQLGESTTGSTPQKSRSSFFGGKIPFFKPTDLDAGYNVRSARETLSEEGAQRARVLPAMSVLVTCIGATIGKIGLARVSCATNQQINALTIEPAHLSAQFLFWFFQSPIGQQQIRKNASATTLPILNKSRFEELRIPLPPLAEQHRIVAEVERRLSVTEELEATVVANLRRAARLRQAILHRAFTGQLIDPESRAG